MRSGQKAPGSHKASSASNSIYCPQIKPQTDCLICDESNFIFHDPDVGRNPAAQPLDQRAILLYQRSATI